jgi:asparagine synthase (glutamine-hydrolysing)
VAERYHTHHHTLALDQSALTPETIQKLLLHFDQPFADSSLIPTYFVSRTIRDRGLICTLSGDGGDEAFGGYACFWRAKTFARAMQMPELLQNAALQAGSLLTRHTENFGRQFAKLFQLSRDGKHEASTLLAGLSSYLSEEQKQDLFLPEARGQMQPVARHFDGYAIRSASDLEELSRRMTETLFRVGLSSDMLRKVDMMSMLAGIEVRVPLLDEDVVACGLSLPHPLKTDGKSGKRVLREIARQWLPGSVARHRKQGFGIPLDKMATAPFHDMLCDLLLSTTAKIRDFLNLRLIEQWLGAFKQAQALPLAGTISREGLYQRIIILLSLELWLRQHRLNWD